MTYPNFASSLADQFAAAIRDRLNPPRIQTAAERYAAIFTDALVEQYAKNSPGQMGLFGDGFGGEKLRSDKTQQRLDWDESKHPRASDGRFGNKPGAHDPKPAGPDKQKTPEQTILGKRAGDAKVIGAMLYHQLEAKEPISLLGQTAKTSEDIASLAQVYRDPRFETLRAFFVKDGVIIGQNAYSSRHPAAVAFPPNMIEDLANDVETMEADGFYLLHNHPSGNPQPSNEDIVATKHIHREIPGKLLDHIIINHNKGTIIDTAGSTRSYESKNENLQDMSGATVPHEYLGTTINSSESLGDLAMKLNPDENRAVMVFTNVKGDVRMLVDVGTENLKQDSTKVLGAVRRAARASNSDRRFLVLPHDADPQDYDHLMKAGVVTDIAAGLKSAAMSGSVMGNDPIMQRIKGKQTARERFSAYFSEAFAERYQAITAQQKRNALGDQLAEAFAEHYAARRPKNSPGQLSMFGDGLGGNRPLRSSTRQQQIQWEESKHPRDPEGKFTEKGQGTSGAGKKPKKPFVYPSGETQGLGADGKPTDGGKPASDPPAEDAKPEDLFDDAGSDPPEDATPRDRAAKATVENDPDYEFARVSAVPNAGEDLKGSARHKVNAWRSLDDAEQDGTAEEMVTRDNLLKNEPHELGIHVEKDPLTALLMHEALRAFPPKPGYGKRQPDAETRKKDRKDYLDAYRDIKKAAEEIAASGESDPRTASTKLAKVVRDKIDRLRREDNVYNNTANGLINFYKKLNATHRSTSLVVSVGKSVLLWKEANGQDGPEMRDAFVDAVHEVLGGKSIGSVMGGSKGTKKPTFNAADLYVAHASREGGPASPAKTATEANEFLVSKAGFRGVQYGNSVSDKEREHHATMAAAAMVDLADVTGLPIDAVGLGGKLGLAIGARGRSSALAHYEPGTKVINLTRKKGVGSLAHEWAHALDHELGGGHEPMMTGRGKMDVRYHSEDGGITHTGRRVDGKWVSSKEDRTGEPKFKAMEKLRDSWAESGYLKRLPEAFNANGITKTTYWTSHREMFARCFERFAQRKLEMAGRKNTYLAGIETKAYKNGGLWPTDAEVDAMAPHFEALLAAHRKDAHGLDEPVKYSAADRQFYVAQMAASLMGTTAERYAAMRAESDYWLSVAERYRASGSQGRSAAKTEKGHELVRGEQGDLGYYITVDGHPVFVEAKSGTIRRGPKHLRDQRIDAVPGKKLRRSRRINPDRSGDRNSPGQKGMFGNGIGGDTLRDPKTQSKLSLENPSATTPDSEAPDTGKFVPRTRLDRVIVDEIGDDPEDVQNFRDMMADAHKMIATEAHEINDDLRNLLSNFGYSGKRTSQIIQTVRRTGNKGGDYDQIPRFDEMADMARRSYPRLLAGPMGESVGYGDDEHALMERLKQGFETIPSRTDERVVSLARDIWDRYGQYDPSQDFVTADDWGDVLEDEPVPFAAAFAASFIEQYMACLAA